MPAFFPRRFTNPEFLRSIAPENLMAFLSPFREYLAGRGLALPAQGGRDVDYQALIAILINPDAAMPKELVDGLYYVHEMSTPEAMNLLLEKAPKGLLEFGDAADPTPGDVAILAWLKDRPFVEERHSERFLVRTKSFICYHGALGKRRAAPVLGEAVRLAFEGELDDCQSKRWGRGSRIFAHPQEDEVWFLVRHGDCFRREGTYDNGQAGSVYYRPDKYDVVIYFGELDRLAVHAAAPGTRKLYRKLFGRHLFGDEDYFSDGVSYTLDPLRQKGEAALDASGVEGIRWIKLKELEVLQDNAVSVVYKAPDLFQALGERMEEILDSGFLCRASFAVRFTESRSPRVLSLRAPAGSGYMRDGDRLRMEAWMRKQGFLVMGLADEEATTALEGA
jgi:hypothetical protein